MMDSILIYALFSLISIEVVLVSFLMRIFGKVESTNKIAVDSLLSQNGELSHQLQKLHLDFLNLNHELNLLAIENKKLNHEVTSLSSEVERLQNFIKQETPND
jgi:peptidoglycan hydrolase CwlO-like protein